MRRTLTLTCLSYGTFIMYLKKALVKPRLLIVTTYTTVLNELVRCIKLLTIVNHKYRTVFQLGLFLRAPRSAPCPYCLARTPYACRFVPMFSSIAHKTCPDLVSFACWIVPNFFCTLPFSQPSWNTDVNDIFSHIPANYI